MKFFEGDTPVDSSLSTGMKAFFKQDYNHALKIFDTIINRPADMRIKPEDQLIIFSARHFHSQILARLGQSEIAHDELNQLLDEPENTNIAKAHIIRDKVQLYLDSETFDIEIINSLFTEAHSLLELSDEDTDMVENARTLLMGFEGRFELMTATSRRTQSRAVTKLRVVEAHFLEANEHDVFYKMARLDNLRFLIPKSDGEDQRDYIKAAITLCNELGLYEEAVELRAFLFAGTIGRTALSIVPVKAKRLAGQIVTLIPKL